MKNKKKTNYISNGQRIQFVLNAPEWIQDGPDYLTRKGQRMMITGEMPADEVWLIYGKKRYVRNPACKSIVNILGHPIGV
ncbi:MAG: hypothetical protein ACOH2V_00415 [Candidatus Saccharimonadaceae bacterium]